MNKPEPLTALSVALLFLFNLTTFSQNFTPARTYSDAKLVQDFLCSEVVYPENDLENGIEGKVIIGFTVEKDGTVSDVTIKEKVNPELDAEALRLFRMLLWEPATSYGTPVATVNVFPIDFNIKKYNKHCSARGYEEISYPFNPVDTTNIVYESVKTDRKPYPVFEEKGMSLEKFIAKNIKYPETAYRQSLSGKVKLRFVVEPQGRVSNIQVLVSVGGGCNQEAIRLLQMVRWMPGIKNQAAVRTFMTMEIDFRLPEDSDMQMFDGQQNSN
jgi:TonB family protein